MPQARQFHPARLLTTETSPGPFAAHNVAETMPVEQGNRSNEISGATLISSVGSRDDKQLKGTCVRKRCEELATDGDYCAAHAEAQRAYQRAYMKRHRSKWRQKKRCTRCGRKRSPDSKWGCTKCLRELGRLGSAAVKKHVENHRDHREGDGWTRTRYHGQPKRGAPSTPVLDSMDLKDALKDLVRATEGYAYAQSEEVQQLGAIQRDNETDSWIAAAVRVRRTLSQIEDRHPETMRRMGLEENRQRGAEIARSRKRTRR